MTTSTTTTTGPEPGNVRTFTDSFDDGTIDDAMWYPNTNGTGVSMAERDGHFQVDFTAEAQLGGRFNMLSGDLGTYCQFPGDFDARVDYELLAWPPHSGVNVVLVAWLTAEQIYPQLARKADPADEYASWIQPHFTSIRTFDPKGALRLARTGKIVTTYYAADRWVKVDAQEAVGKATIGLQSAAFASFSHVAVSVAFDNFSVQAPTAECPR